jgi:pyrroline-5-carboxylate reductase
LDGAVSEGLKREDAKKMLTQSLISLAAILEKGEHHAMLREKFSSPTGTTIAGLLSLDEDNNVRKAYSDAVIACAQRGLELSEE